MIEKAQAVATLDAQEVKILLEAMAFVWASLVAACGLIYKIGAAWVEKVNAKIAKLEEDVNKIPGILAKAIAEHNAEDEHRHLTQMLAIQKNADNLTIPLATIQLEQTILKERVEAVEDSGILTRQGRKNR